MYNKTSLHHTKRELQQIARWFEARTLGSFHMGLMALYSKADLDNREKLRKGFPDYAEAWELWYKGDC